MLYLVRVYRWITQETIEVESVLYSRQGLTGKADNELMIISITVKQRSENLSI